MMSKNLAYDGFTSEIGVIISYLIVLYFSMAYFSMAVPNILLGIIIVLFLYGLIAKKTQIIYNKKDWVNYFLIITPLILTIFSAITSENIDNGMRYIWRRLPIGILPLIILSLKTFFKENNRKLMNLYVCISVVGSCIAIYKGIGVYFEYNTILDPNHTKKFITPIQHPYFGIFQLLALVLILELKLLNNKFLKILFVFFLVIGAILSTSRIVYLFLIIYFIFKIRVFFSKKQLFLIFILTIMSISVLVNKNEVLKKKITNTFSYWHSPRIWYWHNSYKVIKNSENPVLGIGIGDFYEINKLPSTFTHTKKGTYGYNPHNQFIEFGITNGLLGLLYFLALLGFVIVSLRSNKKISYIILIILIGFSFTECILTRQYGVQFYSVFLSFAILYLEKRSCVRVFKGSGFKK